MSHSAAGYEKPLHIPEQRDQVVREIKKALRYKKKLFDGFVVQGYSMSIIGSILAHEMGKQIAVVRKHDDDRNSWMDVEGKHHQRWVFLDDLISSGRTFERVKEGLEEIMGEIVGICLWYDSNGTEAKRTGVPVWMCRHLGHELQLH